MLTYYYFLISILILYALKKRDGSMPSKVKEIEKSAMKHADK